MTGVYCTYIIENTVNKLASLENISISVSDMIDMLEFPLVAAEPRYSIWRRHHFVVIDPGNPSLFQLRRHRFHFVWRPCSELIDSSLSSEWFC